MGKEEKLLNDLLEKVSALGDKLTNMEFLFVQSMGTGGTPKTPTTSGAPLPAATGSVNVDLTPLENKITEIERSIKDQEHEVITELMNQGMTDYLTINWKRLRRLQ